MACRSQSGLERRISEIPGSPTSHHHSRNEERMSSGKFIPSFSSGTRLSPLESLSHLLYDAEYLVAVLPGNDWLPTAIDAFAAVVVDLAAAKVIPKDVVVLFEQSTKGFQDHLRAVVHECRFRLWCHSGWARSGVGAHRQHVIGDGGRKT